MTIKRVTFLQELLSFIGLEGRLHLEWISSAEAQKFVRVATEFTQKIKVIGPSPLTIFHERALRLGLGRASGCTEENDAESPIVPVEMAKKAITA